MSLFQTDAWQSSWWDTWGKPFDLTLIYKWRRGKSGVYSTTTRLKGFFPVRSIEFVGGNYRRFRSTRTEYNSLCDESWSAQDVLDTTANLLIKNKWDEAIFVDCVKDSKTVRALEELAISQNWLKREMATDTAWRVSTVGKFSDYLRSLGRNSRLRLFNRRSILTSLGDVDIQNQKASAENVSHFFSLLNQFHEKRWGKPAYNERALKFNSLLVKRVVGEGGIPQLSALTIDDQVVSVLYNIAFEGCVYNLQSGFVEDFRPKLSLGTLHIGFAIEEAFLNDQILWFDMLAGKGKNENYKKRFATHEIYLVSFALVRSRILKTLFKIRDRNN